MHIENAWQTCPGQEDGTAAQGTVNQNCLGILKSSLSQHTSYSLLGKEAPSQADGKKNRELKIHSNSFFFFFIDKL